jgi:sugar phosphate isomerase/epimerase
MKFPSSFTFVTDEVSQEPEAVVRFAREFQLPGIELRSMFDRAFKDLTRRDVAYLRQVARDEGLRVYGCATPVFKCAFGAAAAIRDHIDIFKRSVETAVALDCKLVRVFTFLRLSNPIDSAILPAIADRLSSLVDIAREADVRVGIENEHSCVVATAEELSGLMTLLPDPRLGIIWDPCNIVCLPGSSAPPTAGYPGLMPRIFHIHVKDAVARRGPSAFVPVGLGEVNWRSHFAEIERSGYKGMLSLETHWRRQEVAEPSLHLPAGAGFSRGGEEASQICMRNIRALLSPPE